MKYDTAMSHYRTQEAIARVLKITKQAVGQWRKTGRVPAKSAVLLQQDSKGKVRVDPKVYERANGKANAGR